MFGAVHEANGKPNQTSSALAELADCFAVLHLRPTAPPPLVDSAYRVLARLNHPDSGGDGENMKKINMAYERLKAVVPA
jgi:curved DNA-binding protein CbpA